MKQLSFFLLLTWTFCLLAFQTQPMTPVKNTKDLVARLKKKSKETNTIIADFTEFKTASYLKEPQKSTGLFYYKKDNKLRWEKIAPLKYIFLVNGDKIKIEDNGKEVKVAADDPVVGKIKDVMLTLVNCEFDSGKVFAPTYFENPKIYFVKLIPKSKKLGNLYDYILLSFSKETLLLDEMTFYEKSGDQSTMTFSNTKVNENIEDSKFTNF